MLSLFYRIMPCQSANNGLNQCFPKSTGVDLDEVINMEDVDKIEVIKGPGASVYGADATGGVINIITRKGGLKNSGSIDLSTGSWKTHNYSLSYSGSAGSDKSFHYFVSANRNMQGNSKFQDGVNDKEGTLLGSKWREEGINARIDKDFDSKHSLKVWYNFKQGVDGYPVSTPNLKYWNEKDWYRIMFNVVAGTLDSNNKLIAPVPKHIGDDTLVGYHNIYLVRSLYPMTNEFRNRDWDIVYTFDKNNDADSFIRLYTQKHDYKRRAQMQFASFGGMRSGTKPYMEQFPNGATDAELEAWEKANLAPFPAGDKSLVSWWRSTYGDPKKVTLWHQERNKGLELQYAKTISNNDIIASLNYDRAKNYNKRINNNGTIDSSHLSRNTFSAYIQDKIHIGDKWDLTPAVRYSKYSSFENTDKTDKKQGKGDTHAFTYALNTEYLFNKYTSMYFGWTKVFRPLREGDYSTIDGVYKTPLKDEKGNVYTLGVKRKIGEKTELAVHYDLTKMSNIIASFPIWNESIDDFSSTAVNAKDNRKSINITLDHQFNDHLSLSASYSHIKDEWKTKSGWDLDPNWGYKNIDDINTAINYLRPQNVYTLNLAYDNDKVYTGILVNWYTGNNLHAFSSNRFLVIDWNFNYNFNKDTSAYVVINNLTNEAYETVYYSHNGIGAASMPSRRILVGMKYKF